MLFVKQFSFGIIYKLDQDPGLEPRKKGLIVNQLQEKTDLAKENYDYEAFNKSEQNKSEKRIWTLPPPLPHKENAYQT